MEKYKKGFAHELLNRLFNDDYERNPEYNVDVRKFFEEILKNNPLCK